MSFSFRNLFAQDENGNPLTGDRTEGSSATGIPGVQEYGVKELLPFIPPAIVAQNGIPMDQSIQIILPEDGSNDVRLSTIYQSCPSLFAAEITPLNDSVVNLPPKPEQATTASPPLSGNPFGNEMEHQPESRAPETMTEDRPSPPALPETNQSENPDFGFSPPQELSQSNGNPFSGTPPEDDHSPQADPTGSAPSESPQPEPAAANNPFSDLPEAQASSESPFETDSESDASPENSISGQGQALSDFFSAPAGPAETSENPFEENKPSQDEVSPDATANQGLDSGGAVFGTDSDSFATLFSQAADADRNLSVSPSTVEDDDPSKEFMLNEGQGEYVGPSFDPSVSPFAGMDGDKDENLGFEAFIPPNMQQESTPEPEPVVEEAGFAPLVQSDAFASPADIFDQDKKENPSVESPEIKEATPSSEVEKQEPSAEKESQPDEKVEAVHFSSPEPENAERDQGKPQENTVTEPNPFPEVKENVPGPVENNDRIADQNEEPLPKSTESEMEKEQEEDRSVLAAALLESGVMMTPSGYRIPDNKQPETPQVEPEPKPVFVAQAEIPMAEPKQEPAPVPTSRHLPVAPVQASSSHPFASTGPALHDIELRAVFATEESFTLTRVAQKVTEMEGVVACAIVTSDDVIENFADPADAIGHKTKDLAEHVRCLASVTGVEGASYFTLHMDQVIMSFFFGDKQLLGVKHSPEAFKPGVREKLVLVARSLEGLEK